MVQSPAFYTSSSHNVTQTHIVEHECINKHTHTHTHARTRFKYTHVCTLTNNYSESWYSSTSSHFHSVHSKGTHCLKSHFSSITLASKWHTVYQSILKLGLTAVIVKWSAATLQPDLWGSGGLWSVIGWTLRKTRYSASNLHFSCKLLLIHYVITYRYLFSGVHVVCTHFRLV